MVAEFVALGAVAVALLAASYRFMRGETLPDRVVALDAISTDLVVASALFALVEGSSFYVSIALVLAVVGFVSTVAISKLLGEEDIVA